MEINNTYIIVGVIIGIALLGGVYYYYDDISNMISYKKEEKRIENFTKKKIKAKPVNIKIDYLDEL